MKVWHKWRVNQLLKSVETANEPTWIKTLRKISFDVEYILIEIIRERGVRYPDTVRDYSKIDRRRALAIVALGKLKSKKVESEILTILLRMRSWRNWSEQESIVNAEDPTVLAAIVKCLFLIGSKSAMSILIDLAQNYEYPEELRNFSVDTLSKKQDNEIMECFIDILKNKKNNELAQIKVIHWLGDSGDKRAIEPLVNCLGLSKKMESRWGGRFGRVISEWEEFSSLSDSASKALNKFGSRAVPALLKVLHSENWRVRYEALRTLISIGDRDTVAEIKKFLNDKNEKVRHLAHDAMNQET